MWGRHGKQHVQFPCLTGESLPASGWDGVQDTGERSVYSALRSGTAKLTGLPAAGALQPPPQTSRQESLKNKIEKLNTAVGALKQFCLICILISLSDDGREELLLAIRESSCAIRAFRYCPPHNYSFLSRSWMGHILNGVLVSTPSCVSPGIKMDLTEKIWRSLLISGNSAESVSCRTNVNMSACTRNVADICSWCICGFA